MGISEAIAILEKHNEWRQYDYPEYGNPPRMVNPTQLGIAIDTVVNHYKCTKCNVEINYKDVCEVCWVQKKQL